MYRASDLDIPSSGTGTTNQEYDGQVALPVQNISQTTSNDNTKRKVKKTDETKAEKKKRKKLKKKLKKKLRKISKSSLSSGNSINERTVRNVIQENYGGSPQPESSTVIWAPEGIANNAARVDRPVNTTMGLEENENVQDLFKSFLFGDDEFPSRQPLMLSKLPPVNNPGIISQLTKGVNTEGQKWDDSTVLPGIDSLSEAVREKLSVMNETTTVVMNAEKVFSSPSPSAEGFLDAFSEISGVTNVNNNITTTTTADTSVEQTTAAEQLYMDKETFPTEQIPEEEEEDEENGPHPLATESGMRTNDTTIKESGMANGKAMIDLSKLDGQKNISIHIQGGVVIQKKRKTLKKLWKKKCKTDTTEDPPETQEDNIQRTKPVLAAYPVRPGFNRPPLRPPPQIRPPSSIGGRPGGGRLPGRPGGANIKGPITHHHTGRLKCAGKDMGKSSLKDSSDESLAKLQDPEFCDKIDYYDLPQGRQCCIRAVRCFDHLPDIIDEIETYEEKHINKALVCSHVRSSLTCMSTTLKQKECRRTAKAINDKFKPELSTITSFFDPQCLNIDAETTTTLSPPGNPGGHSHPGPNENVNAAIIGATVGGFILIGVILLLCILFKRRKPKQGPQEKSTHDNDVNYQRESSRYKDMEFDRADRRRSEVYAEIDERSMHALRNTDGNGYLEPGNVRPLPSAPNMGGKGPEDHQGYLTPQSREETAEGYTVLQNTADGSVSYTTLKPPETDEDAGYISPDEDASSPKRRSKPGSQVGTPQGGQKPRQPSTGEEPYHAYFVLEKENIEHV